MPIDPHNSLTPFMGSLKSIYQAANFGENATAMDANTLRRTMEQIINGYTNAKAQYDALVAEVGATETRNLIATRLRPTPADIGASLQAVRTEIFSLIATYDAVVPAAGARSFTFDETNWTHTEVQVPPATLVTFGFTDLKTALAALAT